MSVPVEFIQEIVQFILENETISKEEIHKKKVHLCKTYSLQTVPADSRILADLPKFLTSRQRELIINRLRKKPMRTISGVAIIAVMTSPAPCPHGICRPCPGGPASKTPQSYTGHEPAAMRASLNDYDPFNQVTNRLHQLKAIGHDVEKIDLIVMGGTFTARSPIYQQWFIQRCLDALNQHSSSTLAEAQQHNQSATNRCIGITIETRPDWLRLQHIDTIISLGATRVELGVQSINDSILYAIHRGHTVSDTILSTKAARNSGLKICYHLMPGLPGSTPEQTIQETKELFQNPCFKPDMIKIYPTLVVKNTELYNDWEHGTYHPLTSEQATELIATMKQYVPEWTRIQRVQRDVPLPCIEAGVTHSNLRQLVGTYLDDHKQTCRCIRCREIGHYSLNHDISIDSNAIELSIHHYNAGDSEEVFLSLEETNHDVIVGYLRLRDLNDPHRSELNHHPCMVIRELRVVGREVGLGSKKQKAMQHRGFGKELLNEAERICSEEFGKNHLFVLSGIGVKPYYRNLGYRSHGVYMEKIIT